MDHVLFTVVSIPVLILQIPALMGCYEVDQMVSAGAVSVTGGES